MFRFVFNASLVVLLTLVSQVGGLAWLVALLFKRRSLVFGGSYVALTLASLWIAPFFGRVPITCGADGPLKMQSWVYCALNRQYVTPELHGVARDLAIALDKKFPGTITLALDANFPYIAGFPLLPHLSHNDGRKLDIAFFYRNSAGYIRSATRSPIGYFAFEEGPSDCPSKPFTLRWNLEWLQDFWRNLEPEPNRMTATLKWFAEDRRIRKVFLEPHLPKQYPVKSSKIRFQGCGAARHDDHFHIQL